MGEAVAKKEPERAEWDNHTQFLLACLAFGVGLGNVWRFPYLIQKYGGGSFVFVFLIMMVFEGIPLLLIEFMLGQRWKRGSVGMWNKLHPVLGGIGIAAAMEAFIICVYYTAIVCWCFFYLFNSFQAPLPWQNCEIAQFTNNITNTTYAEPVQECTLSSPTEYFWYRKAMDITPDITESGGFNWWILIVFAMTWCFVYLCVSKGVESSGKAMYVTSSFPYIVLAIFLIRGLTLEGSTDGIAYLFRVDWTALADPQLWLDAATQVFFSLSVAAGGIIAFASYCPIHQNCMRDALIIGGMNAFTALYVAIVIFSILGFKATLQFHECLDTNIDILSDTYDIPYGELTYDNYDEQVDLYNNTYNNLPALEECDFNEFISHGVEGTGLAFIVFTEAINNMPGSPIWSILFFVMLLLLGLGTVFGYVEGIITPVFDLGVKMDKRLLSLICCSTCAALGLLFTLRSGEYWVNVFNDFGANLPLLIIGMAELLSCIWFFGIDNWFKELRFMIGESDGTFDKLSRWYFYLCWNFISPALLFVVFVGYLVSTVTTKLEYDAWDAETGTGVKLDYEGTSVVVIYLLQYIPIAMIPAWSIYRWIKPATDVSEEDKALIDWGRAWTNVKSIFSHDISSTISK